MTPYELALFVRGQNKRQYRETVRTVSASHLNAQLSRAKRVPPLRNFLPPEPLTKLEKTRKMWESISNLAALGIGKVKVSKGKKKNG